MIGANAGMAGGFIGGACNEWANGASFNNVMYAGIFGAGIGGLSGGVVGGISGAIRALSTSSAESVLTPADEKYFDFNGKGLTESEIEEFSAKSLNIKEGDWGISDITNEIPDGGYLYNQETKYFERGNYKRIVGVCSEPSWWNGKVSVHFATHATMNSDFLKGVMIHEYTHAWHVYKGYYTALDGSKVYENSTENSAINAQIDFYKSIGASDWIKSCQIYQATFQSPAPKIWVSPFHYP